MEWEEDYTPQPPDTLTQIRALMAKDRAEQRRRETLANFQHGIDMFVQARTTAPRSQTQPFDDNLKAFLLSRKVEGEDTDRAWRQGEPERQAQAQSDRAARAVQEQAQRDARLAEQRAADQEADRQWRERQADDERKWREGENAKDRAVREAAAKESRESRETVNEGRKADQERKQNDDRAQYYISDDFTDTSRPLSAPVQTDLNKRAASTRVVLENADQLEKLLDGGPAVYGQRAAQMEMLANNIWTELKDIKGLGVLAGPDMGILQGILADPTQIRSMLKQAGGDRNFRALVQQFKQRLKDDMIQRAKNFGANPTPGGLYDVAPAVSGGPASMKPDPQDAAAKAWAEAHPDDPRAAKIREALRAKGIQ